MKSKLKLFLFLLILAIIATLAFSGMSKEMFQIEQIREFVLQTGFLAPVLFTIIFFFAIFLFIPPTSFVLTSGFLFGPVIGLSISLVCVNLSGIVFFVLARSLGKDAFSRWLPKKLSNYNEKLSKRGLITVLIMRLSFVPFGIVSVTSGISSIRKREFIIATAIGTFPSTFMLAVLGDAVLEILKSGEFIAIFRIETLIGLLLFVLAALFPLLYQRLKGA